MSYIIHKELSDRIIGYAITVHKAVGPGLLERIYENSMCIELDINNIPYQRQKKYNVYFKNHTVGEYTSDLVINNKVIVELKAVTSINNNMTAQLLNYLYISKLRVGYIINFRNAAVEFRRFVL
jgi:GxxExxY protein